MGTTEHHGYSYPESADQPYVHLDLQGLAVAVDADTYIQCTSVTRPPHRPGRRIYETDTGLSWISDGAAWNMLAPFRFAAGGLTITGDGTVFRDAVVQFPPGRFTLAPRVITSCGNTPSGASLVSMPHAISSTQFTIRLTFGGQTFTSGYLIHWWAIQMGPTSPGG